MNIGIQASTASAINDHSNTPAPSQNQLERAGLRRSSRIEKLNNGGPYGWGRGGHEGIGVGNGDVRSHNWTPECRRGGEKAKKAKKSKKGKLTRAQGGEWDVADEPAGTVDALAAEMVSNLSQGVLSSLSHASSQAWIESMKSLVEGQPWKDENGAFVVNSLQSLVVRCGRSLEMVAGQEFVTMINVMQLAAKIDRYDLYHYLYSAECHGISFSMIQTSENIKSVTGIYRKHVKGMPGAPHVSTFRGWVTLGTKFSSLAGAGELYTVVYHSWKLISWSQQVLFIFS